MVMVWVQLVRRISQQHEGNSFYFRKMYGVVNLVGPEVQPSIGNVKHGPLRLPISIDGARTVILGDHLTFVLGTSQPKVKRQRSKSDLQLTTHTVVGKDGDWRISPIALTTQLV